MVYTVYVVYSWFMAKTLTVREFRASLSDALSRAEYAGESTQIERNGRIAAILVPVPGADGRTVERICMTPASDPYGQLLIDLDPAGDGTTEIVMQLVDGTTELAQIVWSMDEARQMHAQLTALLMRADGPPDAP